jgi:elongation factor P
MLSGADLRPGLAVRLDRTLYRIIDASYHGGQGKMGGVMHTRLRNLTTGTMTERSFRTDEALEDIVVERHELQFLYRDGSQVVFMNPTTFEQVEIESAKLGRAVHFLQDGMLIPVEFVAGDPAGVVFPDIVDVKVADTAAPVHSQGTSVWKEATLENGLTLQVPPFIAPGELIRVQVERGEYVERSKRR